MKKSILLLFAIIAFVSCAKKEVLPQPTIEEINAQYANKYGKITFWTKSGKFLFSAITDKGEVNSYIDGGRPIIQSTLSPECGTYADYNLYVGVQSYSIFTTKHDAYYRLVPDSLINTGSVDVKEGECVIINVD